MSRGFLAAVTAACVAFAPCALVFVDPAQAEATTVYGSKSNADNRMGGGGGHGQTKKVKSIKSNSSDRMGGGGGVRGGGAPANTIKLNSSRSNIY
jgi:hypothetical protein